MLKRSHIVIPLVFIFIDSSVGFFLLYSFVHIWTNYFTQGRRRLTDGARGRVHFGFMIDEFLFSV